MNFSESLCLQLGDCVRGKGSINGGSDVVITGADVLGDHFGGPVVDSVLACLVAEGHACIRSDGLALVVHPGLNAWVEGVGASTKSSRGRVSINHRFGNGIQEVILLVVMPFVNLMADSVYRLIEKSLPKGPSIYS